MIVQKDFLNKLRDFGLNTYESKLWTALLSRGVSTAGELSDMANVPRSRAYDVLESLEKKGFVVMKIGKPIKYIAVPPEEVVERVKKRIKEEAETKEKILDELKSSEVLEELRLLHSQGVELVEPADLAGSFKGRDSVYNQIEAMVKGAESFVYIITTRAGFLRKSEYLKRAFKKAAKRGVDIRIAAPVDGVDFDRELLDYCKVRNLDSINARLVIVDGREVLFMLLNDEDIHPSYDAGVWVNTQLFSQALAGLFDIVWKKAPELKVLQKN
ncbi:TrmB family transcriptional regulator [Candidatus Woesearchaeota archaeon]|nr:MAG: TrmB family transcriptional regulator [Candidatus Woesearchaeota archaeon]